jgi:hypothetical protein
MTTTIVKYNQLSACDRACLILWGDVPENKAMSSVTLVAKAIDKYDNPIVFVKYLLAEDAILLTGFSISPLISPQVAKEAGDIIDAAIEQYISSMCLPITRLFHVTNGECVQLRTYKQQSVMGLNNHHHAIHLFN